jgi:hypothetical protein
MTTARFKDFGSGGDVNTQPLSFKLYGEDFECKTALQGKVLLDMVADAGSDSNGMASALIEKFFAKVLLPESFDRFLKLVEDPSKIVTVEKLGEITSWLVEQYSSRPIQGLEDSQSGQ